MARVLSSRADALRGHSPDAVVASTGRKVLRALLSAIILAGVTPSFAAGLSQADALNQLSTEYGICAAYYTVAVTCLRNQSVRADYLEAQHKATILGYAAGAKAGVAVEGLYFESENAMNSMKEMMKGDCDNIASAVEHYAERCEALMKDPEDALRLNRPSK